LATEVEQIGASIIGAAYLNPGHRRRTATARLRISQELDLPWHA